jgi:hypothetical protein
MSPLTLGLTPAVLMLTVVACSDATTSKGDTVADELRDPRHPLILATIAPVPVWVIVGAALTSKFEAFGDVPLYQA